MTELISLLPEGIPPPSELLTAQAQKAVSMLVALAERAYPAVRPADAIGMTILIHARVLELDRVSRKKRLKIAEFMECQNLAVVQVASVEFTRMRAAGILPTSGAPSQANQTALVTWWKLWHAEFEEISDRGLHQAPALLEDPREAVLYQFAIDEAAHRIQPLEELLKTMKHAKRQALRRQGQHSLTDDDVNQTELLADSKLILSNPDDLAKLLTVDGEGRMAIGLTQARDVLKHWVHRVEDPEDLKARDAQAPLESEVLDELVDRESAEVFRAWVAERRTSKDEGEATTLVLDRMADLISGETSLAELSRAHGLPKSTLSETYEREKVKLAGYFRRLGQG